MNTFFCRALTTLLIILFISGLGLNNWAFDHSHKKFDALLSKIVKNGDVNYDLLEKKIPQLQAYLKALSNAKPDNFNKKQKLALWINAYNAYTLKLISDFYPGIKSIQDIGSKLDPKDKKGKKQWDVDEYLINGKKVEIKVAGKKYSLNDIEHKILRKDFKEARIHFAIVCASKGCPPLSNKAYKASNINSHLDKATKSFLNTKYYNYYDASKNILNLSAIFKWFKSDFKKSAGSQLKFLEKYLPAIKGKKPTIKYLKYDWSLNKTS